MKTDKEDLEEEKQKNYLLRATLRAIAFSPLENLTREQANKIRKRINLAISLHPTPKK